MGLIRFLLAVSVVGAHGYFPAMIGGPRAVQIFFMLSGFLISYVLLDTAKYKQVGNFYISRYLRLFPLYAVIGLLTLGFHLTHPDTGFLAAFSRFSPDGQAFLIFTNATLFLQDWTMFLGTHTGQLAFDPDFSVQAAPQFWVGLLNPPGWSLGVELSFYVIAPFILHRRWLVLALLAGSLGLRVYILWLGIGLDDPWRYRFFPTELTLFLLGALAQQVSRKGALLWHDPRWDRTVVWLCIAALVVFPFIKPLTGISDTLMTAPLYLLFLLALPTLFRFQRHRPWDRWIGELSYPIYVCHWMVLVMARYYIPGFNTKYRLVFLGEIYNMATLVIVLPVVLILAWGLSATVGDAMERLRYRFRGEARAVPRAPDVSRSSVADSLPSHSDGVGGR